MENKKDEIKLAMRVSVVSIAVNVFLSLIKFIAGIVGHSAAMVSDGVHSLSDVLSTFVVIIGVNIAGKESDESHQYGHERMESVAGVLLALFLLIAGLGIGWQGIKTIMGGGIISVPGKIALVSAVLSIVIKEWMYWYTRSAALKIGSDALMADAWHHRSDSLSSIGSLIGVIGARMGLPVLDPIASIVICLFIFKVSIDIFVESTSKLVDKSCDKQTQEKIIEIVKGVEGVIALDLLQTRLFGSKIYVDVEISADGELSLFQAHAIAEEVHDRIEKEVPTVKHCMVHVNPRQKTKE